MSEQNAVKISKAPQSVTLSSGSNNFDCFSVETIRPTSKPTAMGVDSFRLRYGFDEKNSDNRKEMPAAAIKRVRPRFSNFFPV